MSALAVSTGPRDPLKQRSGSEPERFAVRLAYAAAVTELEAWFAAAAAGDQAQYASGIDLPRAEPGVVLVSRWVREGRASTCQRRDRNDMRRWQFLVVKTEVARTLPNTCASGPSSNPTVSTPRGGRATMSVSGRTARAEPRGGAARRTKDDCEALLDLLRGRAAAGKPCPGLVETARLLGLARGRRGKNRANYLFGRLEGEGRIAVRALGGNRGRVVTIRARGRACGKSTGNPQ